MEMYILNEMGIKPWEIPLLKPEEKNDLLGMRALRIESDEYENDKTKGKGKVTHLKGNKAKSI